MVTKKVTKNKATVTKKQKNANPKSNIIPQNNNKTTNNNKIQKQEKIPNIKTKEMIRIEVDDKLLVDSQNLDVIFKIIKDNIDKKIELRPKSKFIKSYILNIYNLAKEGKVVLENKTFSLNEDIKTVEKELGKPLLKTGDYTSVDYKYNNLIFSFIPIMKRGEIIGGEIEAIYAKDNKIAKLSMTDILTTLESINLKPKKVQTNETCDILTYGVFAKYDLIFYVYKNGLTTYKVCKVETEEP